ncbi:hypothetical protein MKX03_036980 [Papaver bracteatum]|nr:hypothetical protein MKX03_036980 [Papaver bracteatum]
MTQSEDEQLVVISQVLVTDINIGYKDIVLAFNGYPVKNMKGLDSMVENCADEYLIFELDYQQVFFSLSLSIILETKAAKATTPDILSTHCIPSVQQCLPISIYEILIVTCTIGLGKM